MTKLIYIIIAIVIFGFLIAIHELGHFLVAKASGVKVLALVPFIQPFSWTRSTDPKYHAEVDTSENGISAADAGMLRVELSSAPASKIE